MMLDRKLLPTAAACMCAVGFSSAAFACSFPQRKLTAEQVRRQAQDDFNRASVVIDAEVVEPMSFGSDWKPGLTPVAYLRVIKTFKGDPGQRVVPVVYITSCDIALGNKKERVRLLLTGDGVFTADQSMNRGGILDIKAYFAEIDRLAGQQRSPASAHSPGEPPLPDHEPEIR